MLGWFGRSKVLDWCLRLDNKDRGNRDRDREESEERNSGNGVHGIHFDWESERIDQALTRLGSIRDHKSLLNQRPCGWLRVVFEGRKEIWKGVGGLRCGVGECAQSSSDGSSDGAVRAFGGSKSLPPGC